MTNVLVLECNPWLMNGAAPTDASPVDVVVSSFTFTP
jgi:hypothetical protein